MKILQYRGKYPNFGDELNSWMWPKLLPNFFDEDEDTVFIGIGSTIGDAPAHASRKIICGAGFVPQYHKAPKMDQGQWDVVFVRGSLTAKRLGISPELALGDAGILARTQVNLARKTNERISFMPHWESMENEQWREVCYQADIHLIDPRKPVVKVIEELLRSKLLITEAMHGAIIADAFRIPFVPVMPMNTVHREKWFDWAGSLELKLMPHRLWPSRIADMHADLLRVRRRAAWQDETMMVEASPEEKAASLLSRVKRRVESTPLAMYANSKLVDMAAYRLRQLAKAPPVLSEEWRLELAMQRMLEKVHGLRSTYAPESRLIAEA